MVVPVKYKCPKCGGETDTRNQKCVPCGVSELMKTETKHIPSFYCGGSGWGKK